MSRVGVFRSHNKVGETHTFQTIQWSGTSGAGNASHIGIKFKEELKSNKKRLHWDTGVVIRS